MKRYPALVCSLAVIPAIMSLAVVGCTKKATKIDATESAAPPPPPEEPQPAYVPDDEQVFTTVDIDERAREILQTVYFDYDKYTLRPATIERLELVAKFLEEQPAMRLLCEGHADERGSPEYNIGLGENRAKAIRDYLTAFGLSAARFETTSYGKERPANPDCGGDDACHALNRRVEFRVLAK